MRLNALKPLLFLLFLSLCLAEEPTITAETDLREVGLGDEVKLTVRIIYEDGWNFPPSSLPENLGDAKVLSHTWQPAHKDEGDSHWKIRLDAQLAWYRLGETKVPPLTLKAVSAEGTEQEFTTPELALTIVPKLSEDDTEVAPPKGQVDIAIPAWIYYAGGAILLLIIAIIVWLLFFRKKAEAPSAPPKPLDPPDVEARNRLEALTQSSLLKSGETKAFYVEVGAIIRHFYGRVFNINAEEMTSMEMDDWFRDHEEIDRLAIDINRELQDLCDRVKYAKYDPREPEHHDVVNWAYQLIELLRPKPKMAEVRDVAAG